jgi:hypothetical protein
MSIKATSLNIGSRDVSQAHGKIVQVLLPADISGVDRMFGKIRALIERHILADVPPELSACLDCSMEQCLNKYWETCPNRLARAAALTAPDHAASAQSPTPPNTEANPAPAARSKDQV